METILGKYLNCIADYVEGQGVQSALLFSARSVSLDMQDRIFNSETGGKDISNKSLGGYTNPYKKVRDRAGRQTKSKDLEFTGALRGNIREDIQDGKVVGYIASPTEQAKAAYITDYQKKKGNTDIFRLNEQEWDNIFQKTDKILIEDFKNIANECTGIS